jgi:hypothetical protein
MAAAPPHGEASSAGASLALRRASCRGPLPDPLAHCPRCERSFAYVAVAIPRSQAPEHDGRLLAERLAAIGGGLLGFAGALLPFYGVPGIGGGAIDVSSPSFIASGSMGVLSMLLALFLGTAPLYANATRAAGLVALGCIAAALGLFIGRTFASPYETLGPGPGFYFTFLGYATLCAVYARRALRAP